MTNAGLITSTSNSHNSAKKMFVVVARHGERWDYIQRDAGHNWIATAARPWDPPLSPNGLKQATRLGEHLSQTLQEMNLPPISAAYSSPFLRCRQTACQAVEALNKQKSAAANDGNAVKVKVELGLSESLNDNWYRSWALPGSDGTWGFVPPEEEKQSGNSTRRTLSAFTEQELHPDAQRPVQEILNWKDVNHEQSSPNLGTWQDLDYESSTEISKPFALKPSLMTETRSEQKERMLQVIQNKAQSAETILLVSHGGPVTHLYEKLCGNNWSVHGECTYCCYSIYECEVPDKSKWNPILVNESKYLQDLWSDATSNI